MAPLAEYTVSASYSSDRLRRARPKGSPRRLDVAKSIFGENNVKNCNSKNLIIFAFS